MGDRKYIAVGLKRALLEETVYRCASCLRSIEHCEDDDTFFKFDEKAHINPHSNTQDDSFENLITLCPTCHTKFDKNKNKQEAFKRLRSLKTQWLNASGKYSKIELDLILDLYQKRECEWIRVVDIPLSDGTTLPKTSVLLTNYLSLYLLRNLKTNNLIRCIDNGMNGIKLSGGTLGEVPLGCVVFILTESGKEFCKNFYNI